MGLDPRVFLRGEGAIEFKIDAYDLFPDHDGEDHNIIMASPGAIGVRVYRPEPETLSFDRIEPPHGARSVQVDLESLDRYDRFRVFLSWSPDELGLHIGPHPPVEGELRQATSAGDGGD